MTESQLDPVTQTLQEALANAPKPLSPQILLWTSKVNPQNFILKIEEKRYLGLPRLDCRQQTYWKFHELTDNLEAATNSSN